MNKINKVILASHPLREYGKYVSAWLSNLLIYPVEATTELPTYTLVPPNFVGLGIEENYISFDYVKFAKFYNMEYNKNIWGELFYKKEYNKEAYEYVKSIFEGSLVISYEMEACILEILDYFKIPYIDAYISPIRFLNDQLLCLSTNIKDVHDKILNYRLPEEQIYLQANYLKTFYKQRYFSKIKKEPSVLFIGQTAFDRSLIVPETGEIYSILNHKEEFKKAISGYKSILYKRHPKASNDTPILDYLKSLADVTIVDDNFYQMCSRPDIKKVVAISSGGLIEAKYFGKETESLLHPSVNLQYGSEFDKEKYINVYEHIFSLHFWADILSPICETKDFPENIGFYGQKNMLRNSRGYRDYWGYEDFDHEIIKSEINYKTSTTNSNISLTRLAKTLYHLTYNDKFLKLYKK